MVASRRQARGSVCWAVWEVRKDGSEEGLDVGAVKLDLRIELGCCAAVRSPLLWLSPCRREF